MKKTLMILVTVLALATLALSGCSGSDKKADPIYPACETNDHCAAQSQVCLNAACVDCFKDAQCAKCETCKNNKCDKKANCCKSSKDCAANQDCIVKRGSKEGTCKAR
jgi:hypothetical protein